MKLAKTNEGEIAKLSAVLNELEQITQHCNHEDYEDFKSEIQGDEEFFPVSAKYVKEHDSFQSFWMTMMRHLCSIHFQRILWNCSSLLENCADPNMSHLDFKPDIKKGLELLELEMQKA